MSKLRSYRKDNRITQSAFAERVGALQSTISKIEMGLQVPGLALALKIQEATGGIVTPADLASSCPAPQSETPQ
jgi:transcriptional regulator with XRE-family HTH domain